MRHQYASKTLKYSCLKNSLGILRRSTFLLFALVIFVPASTQGHFLRFNTADRRSVLDISNVFDKTWQEVLQFQLKQNAVFQLITSFFFGFV